MEPAGPAIPAAGLPGLSLVGDGQAEKARAIISPVIKQMGLAGFLLVSIWFSLLGLFFFSLEGTELAEYFYLGSQVIGFHAPEVEFLGLLCANSSSVILSPCTGR